MTRSPGCPVVARAVDAITRHAGDEGDSYYRRVAGDSLALAVEGHDIADNTAPERTALLDPATPGTAGGQVPACAAGAGRSALTHLAGTFGVFHVGGGSVRPMHLDAPLRGGRDPRGAGA